MAEINSYRFGEIEIEGKKYEKDVVVFENEVFSPWIREEGHFLSLNDIKEFLSKNPEVVVFGTGSASILRVPKEVIDFLEKKKIEVYILPTPKATEKYNQLEKEGKKVMGFFHLTC